MRKGSVYLVVFDGLADWEPSFALTGLRRWGKRDVATVGFTAEPVTTMGGLKVMPNEVLSDVDPAQVSLFMMPGGDAWQDPATYPREAVEGMVRSLLERGTPVAAICAATTALARGGFLEGRRHTSNARKYVAQYAPGYAGSEHYEEDLAVRDRGVITASGLGAIEFAREIFREMAVLGEQEMMFWYDMYKTGRLPQ